MKEITIFNFQSNEVRTIMKDGEPWFVAKDVADILGYSQAQAMLKRLDDDELTIYSSKLDDQVRSINIITESGVYEAIFGSKKPIAKKFKNWLKKEVLPTIRKTGGYLNPEVDWSDLDQIQKVLDVAKEERTKRLSAEARNRRLVHNSRTYTTMEIAKELGFKSAQSLNIALIKKGIIFKTPRGMYLPYAEYSDKGFVNIKQKELSNIISYTMEWTGFGREYLIGVFNPPTDCLFNEDQLF